MIHAWHFVGDRLRNGDPVPKDGEWLEWAGGLVMCQSGLHASRDPFDALQYAPGPILCRVECDGEIIEASDKLVCSRRKIIERLDATEGLRYFARMQALSVVHLWEPPEVVVEFLMTGDNHDAAARAAALDAAAEAAWAAWAAEAARAAEAAWAARAAEAARATRAARAARAAEAARAEWNRLVKEAFGL